MRKLIGESIRYIQKLITTNISVQFKYTSIESMEEHQLIKLNRLLSHFKKKHPESLSYLGNFEKTCNFKEFQKFPVISKKELNESFDYFSNLNKNCNVDSTSGSSGVNFSFLLSKSRMLSGAIAHEEMYKMLGMNYFSTKKLTLWGKGATVYSIKSLILWFKGWVINNKVVYANSIDSEVTRKIEQEISINAYKCLNSYPSILSSFLKNYSGKRRDDLIVTLSGETIQEHHLEIIQEKLTNNIYNRYGSREFGLIGHQVQGQPDNFYICPASRFIIENDERGHILVTDLDNYAFPFIRYDIGDIGEVRNTKTDEGCFLTISKLNGRTSDVIKTLSGRYINPQYWTLLSRSVKGIKEFQIRVRDHKITFNAIVDKNKIPERIEKIISNKVYEEFEADFDFEFEIVNDIERTSTGKRKIVVIEN